LRRGLYAYQIKNWLKYFPENQFYITTTNSLNLQLKENLDSITQFLNLGEFNWDKEDLNKEHQRAYISNIDNKIKDRLTEFYQKENVELNELTESMQKISKLCLK